MIDAECANDMIIEMCDCYRYDTVPVDMCKTWTGNRDNDLVPVVLCKTWTENRDMIQYLLT